MSTPFSNHMGITQFYRVTALQLPCRVLVSMALARVCKYIQYYTPLLTLTPYIQCLRDPSIRCRTYTTIKLLNIERRTLSDVYLPIITETNVHRCDSEPELRSQQDNFCHSLLKADSTYPGISRRGLSPHIRPPGRYSLAIMLHAKLESLASLPTEYLDDMDMEGVLSVKIRSDSRGYLAASGEFELDLFITRA